MSYENFAACFPTIAEKAGDTLKGAHRSVVETLGRSARVCLMFLVLLWHGAGDTMDWDKWRCGRERMEMKCEPESGMMLERTA